MRATLHTAAGYNLTVSLPVEDWDALELKSCLNETVVLTLQGDLMDDFEVLLTCVSETVKDLQGQRLRLTP